MVLRNADRIVQSAYARSLSHAKSIIRRFLPQTCAQSPRERSRFMAESTRIVVYGTHVQLVPGSPSRRGCTPSSPLRRLPLGDGRGVRQAGPARHGAHRSGEEVQSRRLAPRPSHDERERTCREGVRVEWLRALVLPHVREEDSPLGLILGPVPLDGRALAAPRTSLRRPDDANDARPRASPARRALPECCRHLAPLSVSTSALRSARVISVGKSSRSRRMRPIGAAIGLMRPG